VSLTRVIKQEAHRLGFTLVGITSPQTPPHMSVYENWLNMGRNGSMEYLGTERARLRRQDPLRILPDCKSIIVLGARYPNPNATGEEAENPRKGRVAAYAWGQDYHQIIDERMQALVAFIEEQNGSPISNRRYTDTGPILERELAQRAGLGWIGKNTCLINPHQGSYFLLAEILLGIALEPDPPFPFDRCGSCRRCIDACPTECILPDRTLDARRCISYLTIENKAEIPEDLRPKMGNRVFGCDVCQTVCPWNRFATEDYLPELAARSGIPEPDPDLDLGMTADDFNQKFKDSPIKRTKRRGYLRNLAVAAGNLENPESIPALEKACLEDEPLIRQHAAWAINQIQKKHPRDTR
jgi:epoxyqueuosine reductase